MRTSIIVRAGAALTASTLALSLGTVAASADDTTSVKVKAATTTSEAHGATAAPFDFSGASAGRPSGVQAAATPAAGDVTLKTFRLNDAVLVHSNNDNGVNGTVSFTLKNGTKINASTQYWPAYANITVNGKTHPNEFLYYTGDPVEGPGGVNLTGGWGPGRVTLSGVKVLAKRDAETVLLSVPGTEVFYARRLVSSNQTYPLTIDRLNSRIKFSAHGIKIVNPYKGTRVSNKTVLLQYATSGGWKTLKTIKLSSSGSGSYTKYTNSKRQYRLYSAETKTATEFRTRASGRI